MARLMRVLPSYAQSQGGLIGMARKCRAVYRREGWPGVKLRLLSFSNPTAVKEIDGTVVHRTDYQEWIKRYDTIDDQARQNIRQRIAAMPEHRPLFSFVMPVYDPPLVLLEEAINSIQCQLYERWELCIADDASKNPKVKELLQRYSQADSRIKVAYRTENGHISKASNSALKLATGEYIALVDNDDLLPEHALYEMAEAILQNPDAVILYSDEDKLDLAGNRIDPYFKSGWNPELFFGHNMISHFGVYRHTEIKAVSGFRVGFEGSQDYDLAIRIIERIRPDQIIHIPKVLYHWRMLPGSASMGTAEKPYALIASEKALNEHLERIGVQGKVTGMDMGMHHIQYALPSPQPLVTIIIPTKDSLELVRTCVSSIYALTAYKNFEIILIDNGSTEPDALEYFDLITSRFSNFRLLRDDRPFNFSSLNNNAVDQANGEYVVLLNNDTEVISSQWLNELISIAAQPGIGAVGAKLLYPNESLQHGGVILGLGAARIAGHMHHNIPKGNFGYFGRAILTQEVSAVTAACLAIKKSIYIEAGGLDEKLVVAFNDVDFCLKVKQKGYRNVWTPHATLYHHESVTRGNDSAPEKIERFNAEADYMREKWGALLLNDPAYNLNLTLDSSDFGLAWPPRHLQEHAIET
jgi:GT2 family glycosyltransferase